MSGRTVALLASALSVSLATGVAAQAPVTKTASVSGTATITGLDMTARTITLRDEKGMEDIYSVGPEIQRFNELKVGDKVKMTYYESLVMRVRKPGDPADPVGTAGAAINRTTGGLPGGTISTQEKTTVTVKAIDLTTPSITVTTADGREVTRKVENKKNLEGVKVGDLIDLTFTRALLTSVERAN